MESLRFFKLGVPGARSGCRSGECVPHRTRGAWASGLTAEVVLNHFHFFTGVFDLDFTVFKNIFTLKSLIHTKIYDMFTV